MSEGPADDAAVQPAAVEPAAEIVAVRAAASWRADTIWIWFFAALFAAVAWWPLFAGARSGLQGGDIYTYFFPLKAWYAERLHAGELPLWNPRIGHGVPALAESQTGVFYPFNLLFYSVLSLGAAYNANFLLHYVLAFGFTCHFARRLGLPLSASLLTAVVFVYGWFPARSCLEWAIVTGAWIPLALWGAESFLAGGRRAWLVVTQCAVLMQLLAGHFNMAFITLVLLALYVPLRLLSERRPARESRRQLLDITVALLLSAGLAAIQLAPSWELKGRSQRGTVEFGEQKIGYGSIPASYLPQLFEPWRFYAHVNDPKFDHRYFGANNTNKVEAHLYFGLVPMCLASVGIVAATLGFFTVARRPRISVVWIWPIVGAACLALVTGWWTRWAAHLPGLGYFTGPGRYGVVVQLAVAVLAGFGVNVLGNMIRNALPRRPRLVWAAVLAGAVGIAGIANGWTSWAGGFEAFAALLPLLQANWCTPAEFGILSAAMFGALVIAAARYHRPDVPAVAICVLASWVDVTLAGQFVQYAEVRTDSPIHARRQSVVGELLRRTQPDARVLARNQNAVSLCDVATVPPYLGIGPREYFDGPLKLPADFHWERTLSPAMRRWLQWSGVTHVLAFDEMDDEALEFVWAGYDPFLHELLGRPPWEPLWLYRLQPARGRAYWVAAGDEKAALDPNGDTPPHVLPIDNLGVSANRVEFTVECDTDSLVVLTDLNYPGWTALVDDRPADAVDPCVFRAVRVGPGRHHVSWVYWSSSFLIGLIISLVSIAGTAVFIWTGRKGQALTSGSN